MNLTPEMIAQGWRPICEIENFKQYRFFQMGQIASPVYEWKLPVSYLAVYNSRNDDEYCFRVLIPQTPDTLTKDDLRVLVEVCEICQDFCKEEFLEKFSAVQDKIRKQLEISDGN